MGNSDHDTTKMRVGGDNGELRPGHCMYVYSIESRLIRFMVKDLPPSPRLQEGLWSAISW